MIKQTKNSAQLSVKLLVCVVAGMALFFSSCKKKETPQIIIPAHRVTFDSKNGTAVDAVTVKAGDILTLPESPTKTGFSFGGWYVDSQASTVPFSTSTAITADLTLYAKWTVFSLSSANFTNGGEIPPRCAKRNYIYPSQYQRHADHLNFSPQLSWANAPQGTTSFLIIMQKYVNNMSNGLNWVVYNLPASKTSLAENDSSVKESSLFYTGPFGEEGETYTHKITIFALDLPENYFRDDAYNDNDDTPFLLIEEAEQKLKDHILASASITGTYTPYRP